MVLTKHVTQEFDYSCGVACVSMWLNRTHEEVRGKYFSHINLNKKGIAVREIIKVLNKNGMRAVYFPEFILRAKGILLVPSLNVRRGNHYVYWDGPGKLYDPNKGTDTNLNLYDLKQSILPFGHIVDADTPIVKQAIKNLSKQLLGMCE